MQRSLLHTYKPTALPTQNIDQWFLRDAIWPHIYHDSLIHDRFFNSYGSHEWPTTAEENHHVGQDVFSAHLDEQEHRLKVWIEKLDCLKLP